MCGIAGYVTSNLQRLSSLEASILDKIRYRGRDSEAVWTDGQSIKLFNTRLSIIDLEGGSQPMHDWKDRFIIVFNGAIYNFPELRIEYERQGAIFRTHSDTEVILQGFSLKRERVVNDLNGMFAFAIWDQVEKRLFLARDRLGKKPLFWTQIDESLIFASTIDAFRGIDGWNDALSAAGLTLYSFLGGFPRETTAFTHAHALPNASYAWFELGDRSPSVSRYWLPQYGIKSSGSWGDLLEEYGDLLADATRIRLRSDVPVALSFSGGTDSGTIAALAKTRFNVDLSCYTIDHHTLEEPSEEVEVARKVAELLKLPWTHIEYAYRNEILEGLADAYQYFDQPCQQLALVYSKRLYDVMRKHCTVVLSGNGADEIFTGYNGDEATARFDRSRWWLRRIPNWLFRRFPEHQRAVWHHARMDQVNISEWLRRDLMYYVMAFTSDPAAVEECQWVVNELADECEAAGIDTMLDLIMHRALIVSAGDSNYRLPDVTGYAAQVEVRSPYLDYRIVEFGARLPHHCKVSRRRGVLRPKYLPRLFYERFVGPDIAWAGKKGMGFNLRWDLELARNSKFMDAISRAYRALDVHGVDAEPFKQAYEAYRKDVTRGAASQPTAGTMMNGFMLGSWLELKGTRAQMPA